MSIEVIVSLLAALGVGGILGAILNRRFERQKQTDEHDIKIFNQSDEILAEQKLSDIAGFQLLSNHSIRDGDYFTLIEWCRFFDQTENKYLETLTKKTVKNILNIGLQLSEFSKFDYLPLDIFMPPS